MSDWWEGNSKVRRSDALFRFHSLKGKLAAGLQSCRLVSAPEPEARVLTAEGQDM